MFFLVGGVQTRTNTLDETPRVCPSCGTAEARLKRVDHYISIFFIPLFPVKRGVPVLVCSECGSVSSSDQPFREPAHAGARNTCARCGRSVAPDFRYCPGCGARI